MHNRAPGREEEVESSQPPDGSFSQCTHNFLPSDPGAYIWDDKKIIQQKCEEGTNEIHVCMGGIGVSYCSEGTLRANHLMEEG